MKAYLIKGGPERLIAVVSGVDGQTVEVQQQTGLGWQTVATYPATLRAWIDGIAPGFAYRLLVTDSASYRGTVSNPVNL